MPYVVRDKNGCVISVIASPGSSDGGRLNLSDEAIRDFMDDQVSSVDSATKELQEVLIASDLSFVRVLEDLISALLDKEILMLTDLPEAAQEKILERKHIREKISDLSRLIVDEDEDQEMVF